MRTIQFTGWQKGMRKIKFIHLLRENTNLTLKESKSIKDRIVDGEIIEIEIEDKYVETILSGCIKNGVVAKIIN